MTNGICDVCKSCPASFRAQVSVNGERKIMELCDEDYRKLARRQARAGSPLETLFGGRSLFDEFFGEAALGAGLPGDDRRGEYQEGGENGVSPRLKDTPNRAFVASSELGQHCLLLRSVRQLRESDRDPAMQGDRGGDPAWPLRRAARTAGRLGRMGSDASFGQEPARFGSARGPRRRDFRIGDDPSWAEVARQAAQGGRRRDGMRNERR